MIWQATSGADIPEIVRIAQDHFETEIDTVFVPDPVAYARNLTLATVAQFYNPQAELLKVVKDPVSQRIIAYTWAICTEKTAWSDEAMICAKMAHVDMQLPVRQRIRLITGMIAEWETWAQACGIAIICSTTMRRDQSGFLDIHRKLGYDVRGSFAYKRLS